MNEELPPWTPATLARHWNCSSRTIRRLIAAGELQAARIGPRTIRIDREVASRFYACRTAALSASVSYVHYDPWKPGAEPPKAPHRPWGT